MSNILSFVVEHWRFCLLHFLEFAIWGSWFVVLGNMLEARGFARKSIARIYGTIPIGTMLASLVIGALVDRYFNAEWVLGISHLVGAALLLAMTRVKSSVGFFWTALAYAIAFAPTLSLVNVMVFAHNLDIFDNTANEYFPWVRVFGTIGWIVAGMSHILILKKDAPVGSQPLWLAAGLSAVLGVYAFTLPATPPNLDAQLKAANAGEIYQAPEPESVLATMGELLGNTIEMIADQPVFFVVTLVAAMAMGLYFAFAALFLEKSGVPSRTVGPVMTLGQWIEIFFMLALPWFLGPDNRNMNMVLLIGIGAWALRFGLFAIGRPLPLVLFGIAIHGICFDFFFAAGMSHADAIAPASLKATAQSVYGFLVYGLGMYLGSEGAGWLNTFMTRQASERAPAAAPDTMDLHKVESVIPPADADDPYRPPAELHREDDGAVVTIAEHQTDWRKFWSIPCAIVSAAVVLFALSILWGTDDAVDAMPDVDVVGPPVDLDLNTSDLNASDSIESDSIEPEPAD